MQLDLMIEGQDGVGWEDFRALAQACEQHGIPSLFRSDHYMNPGARNPERGSLDALGTSIALAAITTKLRLGTLISPATFRHPSVLAKLAVTADHVSGGRFELGIGAGWNPHEHAAYGFDFGDQRSRTERLEELAEILVGSWGQGPFSFEGKHYRLDGLDARPKPVSDPHPRLIIGGRAGPRASALAARFADEYNTTFATLELAIERKRKIEAACEAAGREPIPVSVMAPVIVGETQADLLEAARRAETYAHKSAESLVSEPPDGYFVGTLEQVAEQLRAFADAGIARVICKHFAFADLDGVELIGRRLAPLVSS